jgi:hypothetical protein
VNKWFAAQLGSVGVLLLEFLLIVVLGAPMYGGERATQRLFRFGHKLAGSGGETAIYLAGQTAVLDRRISLGNIHAGVDVCRRDYGNFLRPVLIRKGADLPLLLLFAGVVGGLVAFGFIGIFVGPVILAVADKLLVAWIEGDMQPADTGDRQSG